VPVSVSLWMQPSMLLVLQKSPVPVPAPVRGVGHASQHLHSMMPVLLKPLALVRTQEVPVALCH
jgi:hypothetical protein